MNEEKPPLLYDVVYPPDLVDDIKFKGKCDAQKLAEDGMAIIFDSLLPKELCIEENFSKIPRMFCNEDGKTLIIDVDEYFKNVQETVNFIQTTGVIGDFPLWLFQNTFNICMLFKKKNKEMDDEENGNSRLWANYIQIQNDEADKINKQHWCIILSTHKYLISGFYLDNLLEVHRRKWNNIGNGKTKKRKKNGRTPFTKSIRHEVFKRDKYRCVECGATKEKRCLHIDHIIPVSRGGTDELDNLQTLCEGCNLAKKNRIINRKKP